jgi:hypothetical protein
LQFWINNIPANEEVTVEISPVKATVMLKEEIQKPAVVVNGKKLVFDVKMESGMYIEMYAANDCKLFDAKGKFIKDVQVLGEVPELKAGKNELKFECETKSQVNPRVQVTTIGYGDSIIKY